MKYLLKVTVMFLADSCSSSAIIMQDMIKLKTVLLRSNLGVSCRFSCIESTFQIDGSFTFN